MEQQNGEKEFRDNSGLSLSSAYHFSRFSGICGRRSGTLLVFKCRQIASQVFAVLILQSNTSPYPSLSFALQQYESLNLYEPTDLESASVRDEGQGNQVLRCQAPRFYIFHSTGLKSLSQGMTTLKERVFFQILFQVIFCQTWQKSHSLLSQSVKRVNSSRSFRLWLKEGKH